MYILFYNKASSEMPKVGKTEIYIKRYPKREPFTARRPWTGHLRTSLNPAKKLSLLTSTEEYRLPTRLARQIHNAIINNNNN